VVFFSVNPGSCKLRGECIYLNKYIHISTWKFINSALYRVEWSASRPARFTSGKEPPEPEIWYAAGAPGGEDALPISGEFLSLGHGHSVSYSF
jgi:hypothetical protein